MRIIRPVKVTKDGTFTRASTGTYWDKTGTMQTAAVNALRITYDPANLNKAPYALIEPAATNLLKQSETFDLGTWTRTRATVTPSATVAPDGAMTAGKLVTDTSTGSHYMDQSVAVPYVDGQQYTFSVFAKAAEVSQIRLDMYYAIASTSGARTVFDIAKGVVLSKDDSVVSAKITPLPGGWFKCAVVGVVAYSALFPTQTLARVVLMSSTSSLSWTGDGTSGAYVWGTQFELGNVATSYVKTQASTVGRSADVIGSTGLVYSNIPEADYPAWSATTVYAQGDRVLDLPNHKVLESVAGQKGTATFTSGASGNITMKKPNGTAYVPAVGYAVVFTGTPPTGITSGTTYYVQAINATSFSVSATSGGAAITTGATATDMTALASPNLNIPITNVTQWLDAGYDNRWDMFDDSITSQTSQAGDVAIAFFPGTRLDSIAAFNMVANSMTISFVDVSTGELLYCAKVNLISNSGIQNFYSYLYEPIVQTTECLVDGIPLGLSANSLITVTFRSNGTTKVGGLVFGLEKDIGITEWGAKVGIIDYSVKTKDAFGNYTITPRAFSKRGDFTVQVPTSQVDSLQSLLAQFRATPIVYIGSNNGVGRTQFSSTMIYGFYKDFDINIAYNAYSVCSMTVEGLT